MHAAVKVVDHMPQFPLQVAGKGLRTGVLNVVGDALVVAVVVVVVVGDVGQCLRGKGVRGEWRALRMGSALSYYKYQAYEKDYYSRERNNLGVGIIYRKFWLLPLGCIFHIVYKLM